MKTSVSFRFGYILSYQKRLAFPTAVLAEERVRIVGLREDHVTLPRARGQGHLVRIGLQERPHPVHAHKLRGRGRRAQQPSSCSLEQTRRVPAPQPERQQHDDKGEEDAGDCGHCHHQKNLQAYYTLWRSVTELLPVYPTRRDQDAASQVQSKELRPTSGNNADSTLLQLPGLQSQVLGDIAHIRAFLQLLRHRVADLFGLDFPQGPQENANPDQPAAVWVIRRSRHYRPAAE
ncbi:uncharacterized protein LOC118354098 isoform X1 [Canis lupus dingo]|uniref:uncharacterized protein LOC118354098 isoform X1 n=1 Tax=Canis lupus dingo TaxID=286419 RepID=UPI0015F14D23|nr:uncharacterized protein LOC118354098 isoform X1 [Canis lupus dingo]